MRDLGQSVGVVISVTDQSLSRTVILERGDVISACTKSARTAMVAAEFVQLVNNVFTFSTCDRESIA
jgi:hypothetical protein